MQALLLLTFSNFLTKMKARNSFVKKVFQGGECPLEIETLGNQIAEGCHGLPLSIVVLGGLLANKKLPNFLKLGLVCNCGDECIERIDFPSHLQTLNIKSSVDRVKLPDSIPETITKISFMYVSLDNNGMEVLGKLPKLLILKLHVCLPYRDLHFHAHSFPQLQFLKLFLKATLFLEGTR